MHGSDNNLCFAYIVAKVESDSITMAIRGVFEDMIAFDNTDEV
jgi:hypothetical protein